MFCRRLFAQQQKAPPENGFRLITADDAHLITNKNNFPFINSSYNCDPFFSPWENAIEWDGSTWKARHHDQSLKNLTNLCSMSQFVSEAHISWLWCFCSRFNRAEVSFFIPLDFLLLNVVAETKQTRKTVPLTEEMKTAKITIVNCVCVCVSRFSWESVKWKERVINLTTAFWLNRRKKHSEDSTSFPYDERYQKKKKHNKRSLPMMMNCNTFEFDFDCRSCLQSPFVYQLRALRRRRELSCLLSSLLLRVVLVARLARRAC